MKPPVGIASALLGAAIAGGAVASPAPSDGAARSTPVEWAAWTGSPDPVASPGDRAGADREAELLARCGRGEAGLREVAERVVAERSAGAARLDLDALTFALRAAGEPHVWPRAWLVAGRALDHDATLAKLEAWGATFHDAGDRRCGVAVGVAKDGTEIVAAVAVDAIADLSPLPTRAHVGMFLTLDARVLVPAASPHVVVQGPAGDPRPVSTWTQVENGATHVRARFALERPGAFTVQLVADVGNGPRPVLEARVFADVAPPSLFEESTAPGEDAKGAPGDDAGALAAMVLTLRAPAGLRPLARDARLDALALSHARRMLAARTVGHDVGDGDPSERLERSGARARLVGENVAHAASVRLAHRALYASPSHRANLLNGEFDRVGVAVLGDADGSVWVAEVFAAGLR